jgi:hypothetical protein
VALIGLSAEHSITNDPLQVNGIVVVVVLLVVVVLEVVLVVEVDVVVTIPGCGSTVVIVSYG